MNFRLRLRHMAALCAVILVPCIALAATSTDFTATQESGGPVDFQATSSNYRFNGEIGHPGIGISTSTNYVFWHGTFWAESSGTNALVKWAIPEMRVAPTSTNDDALFYLTVKDPLTHAALHTMPNNLMTAVDGTYLTPIPLGIPAGTYDIGIKTHQHLTRILRSAVLSDGDNMLNFTQADNASSFGSLQLLAGDINGSTSTPATLGDDVVNSVDLSIILNDLDKDDASHRAYRSNLNQDAVVNSVDLSLMLKNLDAEGDK